jgi:hypothetical protein
VLVCSIGSFVFGCCIWYYSFLRTDERTVTVIVTDKSVVALFRKTLDAVDRTMSNKPLFDEGVCVSLLLLACFALYCCCVSSSYSTFSLSLVRVSLDLRYMWHVNQIVYIIIFPAFHTTFYLDVDLDSCLRLFMTFSQRRQPSSTDMEFLAVVLLQCMLTL